MALTREQRQAARAFFTANELAPPYNHELDELQKILAEQPRAAEQLTPCGHSDKLTCGSECVQPSAAEQQLANAIAAKTKEVEAIMLSTQYCEQPTFTNAQGKPDPNGQYVTWQPTQQPAGDVVERMCTAFDDAGGTGNYREAMLAALAEANKHLIPMHDKDRTIAHDCGFNAATMLAEQRMGAALAVAREGYVGLDAVEKAIRKTLNEMWPASEYGQKQFAERLRAHLSPKQPERVTEEVHFLDNGEPSNRVYLDGEEIFRTPLSRDAKRYASGLREELKAGKQ